MITLFSIPKAFDGHIGVIQKNAIRSWTKLPGCQVILFGEEDGLADAAAELGVRHEAQIARNEFGTPMLSDALERARDLAGTPLLAYVNTDIIFTDAFECAASTLAGSTFSTWLMVGQRFDLDITAPLDFEEGWEERLQQDVVARSVLHGKSGIDFFLFPRNFPVRLPPMAVGRPGWDSWLIYKTRASDIPLVDATNAVLAVHQNHPSAYRSNGPEARENRRVAGGFYRMGTLRDTDWTLLGNKKNGLICRKRRIGQLLFSPPVRGLLVLKRFVQSLVP